MEFLKPRASRVAADPLSPIFMDRYFFLPLERGPIQWQGCTCINFMSYAKCKLLDGVLSLFGLGRLLHCYFPVRRLYISRETYIPDNRSTYFCEYVDLLSGMSLNTIIVNNYFYFISADMSFYLYSSCEE